MLAQSTLQNPLCCGTTSNTGFPVWKRWNNFKKLVWYSGISIKIVLLCF